MNDAALLELAMLGARRAGALLLERFAGSPQGVDSKSSPTDPVSDADRDAEALLIELIADARPDDGILAEEGGSRESKSGLTWVLDPLDGTVNFLYRRLEWAVSIAVEDESGGVAAVVYQPAADEMFSARRGNGTYLNGRRVEVSGATDLTKALIGTGFAYDADVRGSQAEIARRTLPAVRDLRRAGSAALDLAALSCGRLDGFYESPMGPWDRAAGVLLIEEAGGVVSDLAAPDGSDPGVVAAGPGLHPALEALVLG
ncbi:MAG: inositol monophosphatase [Actinomycetota bacterium]|nr:inositol monophosphatase [Actinomycetota bacterium]